MSESDDEVKKLLLGGARSYLQPVALKDAVESIYRKLGKDNLAAIAEAVTLLAIVHFSANHRLEKP